ncbi:hypothetical protein EDB86DRAFT_2837010 [Lactarius hatsudake]|nr:hypothetical protein EDB86DRAFT_2837010 [Lactarius hatsudake]
MYIGGGESACGRVLRAVSGWRGGRWRLGLACCIEVAWRGLVRRVEVAWQVGGVLRNVAGSCATWRGLGVCWVRVARVGRVLACHVGSARWVGGGGAGWRWFAFSRPKVLHAVLGWQGGLAMAGCRGRMEVARMHEWPATSRVLHAVLGQRGRLGQGQMEAAHVHEGTAMACNVEAMGMVRVE